MDEEDRKRDHNDFEDAVRTDMLLNTMIRIAKDLERVIIGIFASAGLLGAIFFILVLRFMLGR